MDNKTTILRLAFIFLVLLCNLPLDSSWAKTPSARDRKILSDMQYSLEKISDRFGLFKRDEAEMRSLRDWLKAVYVDLEKFKQTPDGAKIFALFQEITTNPQKYGTREEMEKIQEQVEEIGPGRMRFKFPPSVLKELSKGDRAAARKFDAIIAEMYEVGDRIEDLKDDMEPGRGKPTIDRKFFAKVLRRLDGDAARFGKKVEADYKRESAFFKQVRRLRSDILKLLAEVTGDPSVLDAVREDIPKTVSGPRIVATEFEDRKRLYVNIQGTIEIKFSLKRKTATLNINLAKTLRPDLAQKRGLRADVENITKELYIDSVWTDQSGKERRLSISPTKKMKRSGRSNRVLMVDELNWESGTARGYYATTFE